MDKVMVAQAALKGLKDGMTIGIGGWGPRRKPMALVREILRSEVKDLTLVTYGGPDVGLLCAAGKVKKLIFAFVSLDALPLEPYFRLVRQEGKLEVREVDEGMMMLGLKAAAMGVPFIPTRVGLGTDLLKVHPELKVVASPYDDKDWIAMPALKLDLALVHVDRADRRGVCQIRGADHYMDDLFVRAAAKAVVSCEELVSTETFHDPAQSRMVFWERSLTSAVVHAPGGAHPTSCAPLYGIDDDHLAAYAASAQEGGYAAYHKAYLAGGEEPYQQSVGGLKRIQSLPQTQY